MASLALVSKLDLYMEHWRSLLLLLLSSMSLHVDMLASQRFGIRRAGAVLWGSSDLILWRRWGGWVPSRAAPAPLVAARGRGIEVDVGFVRWPKIT